MEVDQMLHSVALIRIYIMRDIRHIRVKISGPSCSNLTMLLVKDSLKFKLSGNFLLKKCE